MENEILDNTSTNTVTENTINSNNTPGNSVDENLTVDSLAVQLDYYDRYYEQMLEKSDNIIANQETIINNQYESIEQNSNILNSLNVVTFLLGIFLIYYLLRNMIIVK